MCSGSFEPKKQLVRWPGTPISRRFIRIPRRCCTMSTSSRTVQTLSAMVARWPELVIVECNPAKR